MAPRNAKTIEHETVDVEGEHVRVEETRVVERGEPSGTNDKLDLILTQLAGVNQTTAHMDGRLNHLEQRRNPPRSHSSSYYRRNEPIGAVAIEWYCFWEEDFPNATWDFFKEELLLRFGDTTYVNHEIELRNLKQTSSVQEYQTKFERLSSMVKNRPVESKIAHFIGGLNEDIQIEMLRDPPTELRRCFALAKVIEEQFRRRDAQKKVHKPGLVGADAGAVKNPLEVNSQPPPTASTKKSGDLDCEAKSSTFTKEINKAPSRDCVKNSREVMEPVHMEDLGGLGLGDLDPPGLGGEDPSAPCLEDEDPNLPSSDEERLGAMDLGDGGLGLEGRTGDPGLDQG
ncbi:hypothetical protein EJ110_NYTH57288 [Nymphaea thermarum]|nr:hypothetical protein EJ110_NYTH57288 [Nymphaea thermarum]